MQYGWWHMNTVSLKFSRALVKSSVDLCIPSVQLGSRSHLLASDFCLLVVCFYYPRRPQESSNFLQVAFVQFLKSCEFLRYLLEGLFWLMKNCYSTSTDICNFNNTLMKLEQKCESQFSLSIAWDQGTKLRGRSLLTGILTHWAICVTAYYSFNTLHH